MSKIVITGKNTMIALPLKRALLAAGLKRGHLRSAALGSWVCHHHSIEVWVLVVLPHHTTSYLAPSHFLDLVYPLWTPSGDLFWHEMM